jgi:hypothetical protein
MTDSDERRWLTQAERNVRCQESIFGVSEFLAPDLSVGQCPRRDRPLDRSDRSLLKKVGISITVPSKSVINVFVAKYVCPTSRGAFDRRRSK